MAKRRRAPRRAARRSRRTLTILLVLVLVSVTVDQPGRERPDPLADLGRQVRRHRRLLAGAHGRERRAAPVGDLFAGAVHYGSLQQENQKLRAEIGKLRQQLADGPFQQRQQHQLRQLLTESRLPTVASIPSVVAQTIAKNPSDFTVTITIDKGRAEGVAVTDPVIGGGGLVGKVVRGRPRHRHSAASSPTGSPRWASHSPAPPQYAVAAGQGAGKLLSGEYIAPATPRARGREDGHQRPGRRPTRKGIPVAQVTSVRDSARRGSQKTVRLRPLADLAHWPTSLVVQWAPSP